MDIVEVLERITGESGDQLGFPEAQAAADETRRLRAASRWIPVTERLPEIEQRVLGFWMRHRGAVQSVRCTVGGWLDDDGNVTTPPTHWMPLPRPPSEETP